MQVLYSVLVYSTGVQEGINIGCMHESFSVEPLDENTHLGCGTKPGDRVPTPLSRLVSAPLGDIDSLILTSYPGFPRLTHSWGEKLGSKLSE